MPMVACPHVRWMIRRDMAEVLEIEKLSEWHAWQEEDFLKCLRERNCIGMVAERNCQVIGFMIYDLLKHALLLRKMAVHPDFRRQGFATAMIGKLQSKLASHRRVRILADVRETNLSAQLFFRANLFQATRVRPAFFEDSGEDAYRMVYRLGEQSGADEE